MKNTLEKQLLIPANLCDINSNLSIQGAFALFMNLACEHGPEIDLGMESLMKKGMFWLTVKTRIHFYSFPKMLQPVSALSWPERPGRIRCNRYYQLVGDSGVLMDGKTEWAVIEMETGRFVKLLEIHPEELEFNETTLLPEPFLRIDENFDDAKIIDTYKIRSTDIDLGKHLNNANYPRIFLGALSNDELSSLIITEAEINFRAPCFEGEILTVKKREGEGYYDLALIKENGLLSATMRLSFDKKN